MTPDELKAELAQLAVENGRLDEVVKLLNTAYCFMLHAPDEVEAYGLSGVYTTKNPLKAEGSDWCDRANALINPPPPTPGIGAAMLRVVEAAKKTHSDHIPEDCTCYEINNGHDLCSVCIQLERDLDQAVQALNEMDAKQ